MSAKRNIDTAVVAGFGDEWDAFDQIDLPAAEHQRLFNGYFSVFPKTAFTPDAEGFDLGCGSGRWAALVAPKVGKLHCIDPSPKALAIAQRRLVAEPNVAFHVAGADTIPLADNSQDFGYSLGVLHHIPDTAVALRDCVAKLKPGAPFLVYLYYAFDNRPGWFRALWSISEMGRRTISRLPFALRKSVTEVIAALVYWPLARAARAIESLGFNVTNLPLSFYRKESFYTMRTDALDRFGTGLEQRFTRAQIAQMMNDAGLSNIIFREEEPYWTACGYKQL